MTFFLEFQCGRACIDPALTPDELLRELQVRPEGTKDAITEVAHLSGTLWNGKVLFGIQSPKKTTGYWKRTPGLASGSRPSS